MTAGRCCQKGHQRQYFHYNLMIDSLWNPVAGEFISHPTSLHITAHLQ